MPSTPSLNRILSRSPSSGTASLLFFFRLFLFLFFGDRTRLPASGNKQVGQRFLEVRGSLGGGLALPEVKALKIGQAFQVFETSITDSGAVKIQIGQVDQPFQMRQSGIGHRRVFEVEGQQV